MKYSRKKKSLYKRQSKKERMKKKKYMKKKRLKSQKGGFFGVGTIINLAMLPFTHIAKPAFVAGVSMIKNRVTNNTNAMNTNAMNNTNDMNNNAMNNTNAMNNNATERIINNSEIKKYIYANNLNIHTLKKLIKFGDIDTLKKIIEDLPTYNSKV